MVLVCNGLSNEYSGGIEAKKNIERLVETGSISFFQASALTLRALSAFEERDPPKARELLDEAMALFQRSLAEYAVVRTAAAKEDVSEEHKRGLQEFDYDRFFRIQTRSEAIPTNAALWARMVVACREGNPLSPVETFVDEMRRAAEKCAELSGTIAAGKTVLLEDMWVLQTRVLNAATLGQMVAVLNSVPRKAFIAEALQPT